MATQRFLVMVNFRTLWTGEHRGDGRLAQGHPHLGAYYNIVLCFKLKMRLKLGGKAAGYLRHTQNAQTKKKNTLAKKIERWLQQNVKFQATKRQTQKGT